MNRRAWTRVIADNRVFMINVKAEGFPAFMIPAYYRRQMITREPVTGYVVDMVGMW